MIRILFITLSITLLSSCVLIDPALRSLVKTESQNVYLGKNLEKKSSIKRIWCSGKLLRKRKFFGAKEFTTDTLSFNKDSDINYTFDSNSGQLYIQDESNLFLNEEGNWYLLIDGLKIHDDLDMLLTRIEWLPVEKNYIYGSSNNKISVEDGGYGNRYESKIDSSGNLIIKEEGIRRKQVYSEKNVKINLKDLTIQITDESINKNDGKFVWIDSYKGFCEYEEPNVI